MSIKTIVKALAQGLIATFLLGTVIQQSALAGEGALLGVQPGFPKIDFSGTTGQGCTYTAGTDTLTITGTPTLTFFGPLPAGPIGFISGGAVSMSLTINDSGVLSGGTFAVNGTVIDPSGPTAYGDPLLTGSFSGTGDYGLVNLGIAPGTTDVADLRAAATGGSMLPLYAANSDIGVAPLSLELSNYSGTMTTDWMCGRAKGVIGPVPITVAGEGACSQGFWKNHAADWPVTSLTLGSVTYTQSQLIALLQMKAKGDKSVILAKQLIAAKLNILGGSDPSCIQSTIDAADDWLDINAPGGLPGNVTLWNDGQGLKDDLDGYNNGEACAGFCTR